MFAKETYINRRSALKQYVGGGLLLFLGNEEQGLNYEDNSFRFRQDSTFLYYFGISAPSLAAIIDIDENREIIFGLLRFPIVHTKVSKSGLTISRILIILLSTRKGG